MSEKPENPLAFPESCTQDGYRGNVESGMTLRDYFAAAALQGLLAAPDDGNLRTIEDHQEHYADIAYGYADAMLRARENAEEL